MNYKLEKFWNTLAGVNEFGDIVWTINLKSFEIVLNPNKIYTLSPMNYKLEKFWNKSSV